jgi:hypothetical protein
MWLEIKAVMTSMACIFLLLGVLLPAFILVFFAIGLYIFGDILIGYQITANELKPQMDTTPPGYELTIFQEIGGRIHFINTLKAQLSQRKFRFHRKEAIAFNDGKGMFTLPNGNRGFFSHERYDKNIDPARCKVMERLPGDNIKEIYNKTLKEIEKKDKELVK